MKILKLLFCLLFVATFLRSFSCFAQDNPSVEKEVTIDSLLSLATKYISFDNEVANLYAQQGRQMLEGTDYHKRFHNYYYIKARISYYEDDYKNAEIWLDSVYMKLNHNKNTPELADYFGLRAMVQVCKGNFQEALEYSIKSSLIEQEISDIVGLARSYNYQANIYLALGDVENAEKQFKKALSLNTQAEDPVGYANILNTYGRFKSNQDSTAIAKKLIEEAYNIYLQNGDLRGIAGASKHLARIAKNKQRFAEAIRWLEEAEQIYLKLDEKYGRASILLELSTCNREMENYPKAIDYGKQALLIAQEINSDPIAMNAHLVLSKGYRKTGDFEKALDEYIAFSEINSETVLAERNKTIENLVHKAEILEKENDIELLGQKNRIRDLQLILLLFLGGLLFIGAVFFIYRQRMRNKSLEQEHLILEERNRVVEVENKLNEQQKQMLENDLELKNKELASKALALLQLNETLHDIGERINDSNKHKFDPALKNSIIREIQRATHNNIWEEFDVAFKQVHNSFYESLLEKCPNLSSTEIKIAALLRLNLSTKEIASITYKSDSAIKIARHRIRTKLGLESNDNLISYLLKL